MEEPNDPIVATTADRTIPTSEKSTSRLSSQTQGSEEHCSATVLPAHLQTASVQTDSQPAPSMYSLQHARMVSQPCSTLRRSKRVRRLEDSNENVLAETADGSIPSSTLPPQSPRSDEHQLAAAAARPLAPISAEINDLPPTGLAPNAAVSNASEQMPLREATVGSNNIEDRLEENVITTNQRDEQPTQSLSFFLSDMADLLDDSSSSQNEVNFQEPKFPLVTVNGYRVKEQAAPTLRSIILKHGDIAANCKVQTMKVRSSNLEHMCDVVQKLLESEFLQITPGELSSMRALVGDLEVLGLDIGWLRQRLDDICEAKHEVKLSSTWKEAKALNKQVTEEFEREVEKLEAEISLKKDKLAELKAEGFEISEKILDAKKKVGRFYRGSLGEGLI